MPLSACKSKCLSIHLTFDQRSVYFTIRSALLNGESWMGANANIENSAFLECKFAWRRWLLYSCCCIAHGDERAERRVEKKRNAFWRRGGCGCRRRRLTGDLNVRNSLTRSQSSHQSVGRRCSRRSKSKSFLCKHTDTVTHSLTQTLLVSVEFCTFISNCAIIVFSSRDARVQKNRTMTTEQCAFEWRK